MMRYVQQLYPHAEAIRIFSTWIKQSVSDISNPSGIKYLTTFCLLTDNLNEIRDYNRPFACTREQSIRVLSPQLCFTKRSKKSSHQTERNDRQS
jgi:hypothetical protein